MRIPAAFVLCTVLLLSHLHCLSYLAVFGEGNGDGQDLSALVLLGLLGSATPAESSGANASCTTAVLRDGIYQGCALNLSTISFVAGSTGDSGYADGVGSSVRFFVPGRMATDGTYLYIPDSLNDVIRRLEISSGTVSTVAGQAGVSGTLDGVGSAARLHLPQCVTLQGSTLYIADHDSNNIRSMDTTTFEVTTLAGSTSGFSGAVDATGASARFHGPRGVSLGGDGYLYVTDSTNHSIRRINLTTKEVTTFAGSLGVSGSSDGVGSAARFKNPYGIISDGTYLYVADLFNYTIRRIELSTATVTTIAGFAGVNANVDGVGTAARMFTPASITTDGTYLYIGQSSTGYNIRRLELATNTVTQFAGKFGVFGNTNGDISDATFVDVNGFAVMSNKMYVVDRHWIRLFE